MNTVQGTKKWRTRVGMVCCLASAISLAPDMAHAQRFGGGGARAGSMARSSISGANHASKQAVMQDSRPKPSSAGSAGNRMENGDVNVGNQINTGDINVGRDVDVEVDHDGWGGWHDVDVDIDGGPGDWDIDVDVDHYHPLATAAAVAGSYYYAVPVGCPIVYTYPHPYYYCNNVYYEERMEGDTVVYVVVKP